MIYSKFSHENGIIEPKHLIQIDFIDPSLKTAIWNAFYSNYVEPLKVISRENGNNNYATESDFYEYFYKVYRYFLGGPIDQFSDNKYEIGEWYKKFYEGLEWNQIYDLINFTIENPTPLEYHDVKNIFSFYLKKHLSGYTIIEKSIVAINDDTQVKAIEAAIKDTSPEGLKGAKTHLNNSLRLLADKQKPDYSNSIKESISAVESICKKIAGDDSLDLNGALKIVNKKTSINSALSDSIKDIYRFTCDTVRHGNIQQPDINSEDAIYILVTCSTFISYLKIKAQKAGIDFSK